MTIFRLLFSILIFSLLFSCGRKPNYNVDVSNIELKTEVVAFNDDFYNSNKELQSIKSQHAILFDNTEDAIWEAKRKDSLELSIQKQIKMVYSDYTNLKNKLNDFFKHIKYYYPKFIAPKVYFYTSKLEDFADPITYVNDQRGNYLFISIDCFLGETNKYYASFPDYIKKRMTPDGLLALSCEKIAEKILPKNDTNISFLSAIIYQGKKMILASAFLPHFEEYQKIGYTKKEMEWCKKNEKDIWNFFVSENAFYSPDPKLIERFIELSPFSKFYTEIDAESPGSIGTWLGWEIANAYLSNNKSAIQEFISITDANLILKKSGYNP
jgi:hypothetical protein